MEEEVKGISRPRMVATREGRASARGPENNEPEKDEL
jgi:hypothetical protein